jgi:hypothetical protein
MQVPGVTHSQPPAWDDVVCAASRTMSSPVCDEIGLLGLDGEIYRDPGSTPARVWTLVRHPIKVGDIHRRIVEDTGRDEESVRKEMLEALAQLRQAALVEVRSGGR